MKLKGVYLPIITPFKNGEVDFESYRVLINHYLNKGISGIIPLGTTGESPTIDEKEFFSIIETTIEEVQGKLPIYIGMGGNNTKEVIKKVSAIEKYPIQGILSVTPYYSKPSQQGIYNHFKAISDSTNLDMIIYNIPYRTGINIENETLLNLANLRNIVGLKDCCGNLKQTMDFIGLKPEGFSVVTGEDIQFYISLALGGDGGILASSHINTEKFVEVFNLMQHNNHKQALTKWNEMRQFIPYLFKESNPSPLKYILGEKELISSSEVRLPLSEISIDLKNQLNALMNKGLV